MTPTSPKSNRKWFERQTFGFLIFPAIIWAIGVSMHGQPYLPNHDTLLSMLVGACVGAGLFTALLGEDDRLNRITFAVFQGVWLGCFLILTSGKTGPVAATVSLVVGSATYGGLMYALPKPLSRTSHTDTFVQPQAFTILVLGWSGALGLFWIAPDVRIGVAWAATCFWLAPTHGQPTKSPRRLGGALASVAAGVLVFAAG